MRGVAFLLLGLVLGVILDEFRDRIHTKKHALEFKCGTYLHEDGEYWTFLNLRNHGDVIEYHIEVVSQALAPAGADISFVVGDGEFIDNDRFVPDMRSTSQPKWKKTDHATILDATTTIDVLQPGRTGVFFLCFALSR